jgi:hypothetical protein
VVNGTDYESRALAALARAREASGEDRWHEHVAAVVNALLAVAQVVDEAKRQARESTDELQAALAVVASAVAGQRR